MSSGNGVDVWSGEVSLPTYLPEAPDKNPMFFEKRVYQGSNGKVYPLPFTDRIAEKKTDRAWKSIRLENEFLRVTLLPELGGRIHAIYDKTSGQDIIYNQPVIKPALVGLAGPWASGGIEFNWPQHHRPATFLPVDTHIEEHPDGSHTVWCSDHDPMTRMKGMHGACLHPGKAYLELRVRAYNRTPFRQTFLWWANAATRVHEAYQSFFPPDVSSVADHARRAMSQYPLCEGYYYGVNYRLRGRKGIPMEEIPTQFLPPRCRKRLPHAPAPSRITPSLPDYAPNDLSFYANIPTPCSYMCIGSEGDFSGTYDYFSGVGLVHIASHHIAPGKKQWTWGNHPFGYMWDRNLTDPDAAGEHGPYIEIMAGVYTDNQPDFSFLEPGETRTWSQFWYPIRGIGPACHATLDAALSLQTTGRKAQVGISVTRALPGATVIVSSKSKSVVERRRDLLPAAALVEEIRLSEGILGGDLEVRVLDSELNEVIRHRNEVPARRKTPPPATEPLPPVEIASADELFITGLHLDQYRHTTYCPTAYWLEALRRDPMDSRCNNAMGRWHLQRGEFQEAARRFQKAIERLTMRNANPADGEPFYNLGLTLIRLGREKDAYSALYKATWNQAWVAASFHAIAELDCRHANWPHALEHLDSSLRHNTDNTRARNLKSVVLRRLGRTDEAEALAHRTLEMDPLDWWARWLCGEKVTCDAQTMLDLAQDFARAGLYSDAIALLKDCRPTSRDLPDQSLGAKPLVLYTLAWLHSKMGDDAAATATRIKAADEAPDYCFPARLEEIEILSSAIAANPRDARAPYYLGNLYYDRKRYGEAIRLWERSAKLDPSYSVVWRNLGIAYFNIRKSSAKAMRAYDKAFATNRADARLLFERDQLWKRLARSPGARLAELEKYPVLIARRDDLSIELCALYNQTGQPEKALEIISTRTFQPWEGGEGKALGQYVRTHLLLGRKSLSAGKFTDAIAQLDCAMHPPFNLGEARHLIANPSDVHYWLGVALDLDGRNAEARTHWRAAASFREDFHGSAVRLHSEMTFYSALALRRLGRKSAMRKLLREMLGHARTLRKTRARLDYFAASLPTMLLFDTDIQYDQETTAMFLESQVWLGLGRPAKAKALLTLILARDPHHALAADLTNEIVTHYDASEK